MRWLVVFLLLAGCTSPSETQGEGETPIETGNGNDGAMLPEGAAWSNGTTTLTIRSQSTPIFNSYSGNCVNLGRGGAYTILGGTITMTWTPETPLAQELEIRMVEFFGDNRSSSGFATSPLVFDVDQTMTANGDSFVLFGAFVNSPSVTVAQSVSVEFQLMYRGQAPDAQLSSCALS